MKLLVRLILAITVSAASFVLPGSIVPVTQVSAQTIPGQITSNHYYLFNGSGLTPCDTAQGCGGTYGIFFGLLSYPTTGTCVGQPLEDCSSWGGGSSLLYSSSCCDPAISDFPTDASGIAGVSNTIGKMYYWAMWSCGTDCDTASNQLTTGWFYLVGPLTIDGVSAPSCTGSAGSCGVSGLTDYCSCYTGSWTVADQGASSSPTATPTSTPAPTNTSTPGPTATLTATPTEAPTSISVAGITGYVCFVPYPGSGAFMQNCPNQSSTYFVEGALIQVFDTSLNVVASSYTDKNGYYSIPSPYNYPATLTVAISSIPISSSITNPGWSVVPSYAGTIAPGQAYSDSFVFNDSCSVSCNDWQIRVGGFSSTGVQSSALDTTLTALKYVPVLQKAGYYGLVTAVALSTAPCFGSVGLSLADDTCNINVTFHNMSVSAPAQLKVWYSDGTSALVTINTNAEQSITGVITQVELLTDTAVSIATDTITQIAAAPTPAATSTPVSSGGSCTSSYPPFPWAAIENNTGVSRLGEPVCATANLSPSNTNGNPVITTVTGGTITLPPVTLNSTSSADSLFVYIPAPALSHSCNNCQSIAVQYSITCGTATLTNNVGQSDSGGWADNGYDALWSTGPGSASTNYIDQFLSSINFQGYWNPYLKGFTRTGASNSFTQIMGCVNVATAPTVTLQVEVTNDLLVGVPIQLMVGIGTATAPAPNPTSAPFPTATPLPAISTQTQTAAPQDAIIGCDSPGFFLFGPCSFTWVTTPIVNAVQQLQASVTSAIQSLQTTISTGIPSTSTTSSPATISIPATTVYTGTVNSIPATGNVTGTATTSSTGVETVTGTITQADPVPQVAPFPITITIPDIGTVVGTATYTSTDTSTSTTTYTSTFTATTTSPTTTTTSPTTTTTTDTTDHTECAGLFYAFFSGFAPLMSCLFVPTKTLPDLFTVTDTQTSTRGRLPDILATKIGFADFFELKDFICGHSNETTTQTENPNQACDINSGLFGIFQTTSNSWTGYIPWLDPANWQTGTPNTGIITWTINSTNPLVAILQSLVTLGIIIFAIGGIGSAILGFFGIGSNQLESLTEEQGQDLGEDSIGHSNHSWGE